LLVLTLEVRGQGTLILQSGYVGLDGMGNVDFRLVFNRAPDLFSSDQYGRQADAFQFFIATTTNVPIFYPPRPYASLIRGGEIHSSGGVVIRDDGPPADWDTNSGGWGPIRGIRPFDLTGDILTFSIPTDMLNVQGDFAYSLLLTSFGEETRDPYTGLSGGPIPVPEPSSFILVLAIAAAWMCSTRGRRGLQRSGLIGAQRIICPSGS